MNTAKKSQAIGSAVVPEHLRHKTLPKYFRLKFPQIERAIYAHMLTFSPEYKAGEWEQVELDNDSVYLRLVVESPIRLECPGNYFSAFMSADAASIAVCLHAYNYIAVSYRDPESARHYERLKEFAEQHFEADTILAVLNCEDKS